jgi:uncharacterized MnhB-related membrane protein
MAAAAVMLFFGLQVMGLGPTLLSAFAPDLALTLAVVGLLLCAPAALRAASRCRRRRKSGADG